MELMFRRANSFYSHKNLILACLVIGINVLFLASFSTKYCTSTEHVNLNRKIPEFKTRVEGDELDAVLHKVENNMTLIIAVINKAYVEAEGGGATMLDLFIEGFWQGIGTWPLIKNVLFMATDRTAYERCVVMGLHCYYFGDETDGSDLAGENVFMSDTFINMMWRRTSFLLDVLRKGYNFIFTDTDVLWLRSPFKILNANDGRDIQFSTDWFNGDEKSGRNHINTGFYLVRSTNGTVALFEKWYGMKEKSTGLKEQDVLQQIVSGGGLRELNVTASYLETRRFSGFCQESQELEMVVTVHANCCRYIRNKVKDLARVIEDWKRFKLGVLVNGSSNLTWSSIVVIRLVGRTMHVESMFC